MIPMKLFRYGPAGAEKPGLVDAEGKLRDLSHVLRDIVPDTLSPSSLSQLAALNPESLPLLPDNVRFGVPWTGITKCVGIGLNYADHAREAGLDVPNDPIIFLKAPSSICGPNEDTQTPAGSTRLDWEVELGVVIGTEAKNVSEEGVERYIAGYCLMNDISERSFQMESSQWDKGKGCDTFGPVGPWLVTKDEITDPQNLDLWLDVNGKRMQDSSTAQMIFGAHYLVSYVSRYMRLLPGDLIATGTPAGVGMGQKPQPVWLKPNDIVELGISGLGQQKQRILAPSLQSK